MYVTISTGGENCHNTNTSIEIQSLDAQYVAYFLEEFAAEFHQKAIRLRCRMITEE